MNKNRLGKRVAVAAGFFFLCVAPRLTRAQSSPPSPVPGPRTAAPVARPKKTPSPKDDFAGLSLTDDQKAKIDQIHESMKPRIEAVVKDQKLTPEQRDAMLDGYDRMERGQIYRVLTTAQQKEVRDKARARHAAEQAEKKGQSPPK